MTGDVLLREVSDGDLPIFFEHQRQPDANRMAAFPARDREAFMAHWMKVLGDETIIKKTIVFDGQVAGNIVSFGQSGEREVGYWLGEEFWGRGIATRALSEFLRQIHARPLYAFATKHNHGSLRVLEKCGFRVVRGDKGLSHGDAEAVEGLVLKLDASERDEVP